MAREVTAAQYALRRLGGAVAVWLLVSVIAFALGTLAPGDPAQVILLRRTGDVPADAEVRALRHEMGLDRPLTERYARWLGAAVRGDLGISYRTGQPVMGDLRGRFSATLILALGALAIGIVIALPLALLSAARRDGVVDHAARLTALAGVSLPSYLVAYLLILLFAVRLGLFPVSGAGGLRHLALPALTLGLGSAAGLTRLLRATLLDELSADYVRTARAKGLAGSRVLMRHALRNALNPVVTVGALRLGRLLGEAAIVETVFAWPGVGLWIVSAIYDRDYPAIQGFVLYLATVFTLINLAVDLSYRMLDPRVRLRGTASVAA